jgi:hypothetical protein
VQYEGGTIEYSQILSPFLEDFALFPKREWQRPCTSMFEIKRKYNNNVFAVEAGELL